MHCFIQYNSEHCILFSVAHLSFDFALRVTLVVIMYMGAGVLAGAGRGQKRGLIPWELELQMAVSCPIWMLGIKISLSELKSSKCY